MNPSLPCLPRKPPSKEPSEEEDWFLTSDELQQALLSDNNNNFDIRVVHLLVTMFSSDAAGTLDLSEFREMWNYVDQWKVIFETYQNELPMTMDRFQSTLSQMGFSYSMELSTDLFRRFNHSQTAVLVFDEFIHCLIILQRLHAGMQQYDSNPGTDKLSPEEFISTVLTSLY